MKKMGSLVFFSYLLSYGPEIVSFLQFLADVSKKSKAVIEIYVYASESSCFALLEKLCWLFSYNLEFRRY